MVFLFYFFVFYLLVFFFFFFFQAEDGIRDYKVTGVQTCALPIWGRCRTVRPGGQHPGQTEHRRGTPTAGATPRYEPDTGQPPLLQIGAVDADQQAHRPPLRYLMVPRQERSR